MDWFTLTSWEYERGWGVVALSGKAYKPTSHSTVMTTQSSHLSLGLFLGLVASLCCITVSLVCLKSSCVTVGMNLYVEIILIVI